MDPQDKKLIAFLSPGSSITCFLAPYKNESRSPPCYIRRVVDQMYQIQTQPGDYNQSDYRYHVRHLAWAVRILNVYLCPDLTSSITKTYMSLYADYLYKVIISSAEFQPHTVFLTFCKLPSSYCRWCRLHGLPVHSFNIQRAENQNIKGIVCRCNCEFPIIDFPQFTTSDTRPSCDSVMWIQRPKTAVQK